MTKGSAPSHCPGLPGASLQAFPPPAPRYSHGPRPGCPPHPSLTALHHWPPSLAARPCTRAADDCWVHVFAATWHPAACPWLWFLLLCHFGSEQPSPLCDPVEDGLMPSQLLFSASWKGQALSHVAAGLGTLPVTQTERYWQPSSPAVCVHTQRAHGRREPLSFLPFSLKTAVLAVFKKIGNNQNASLQAPRSAVLRALGRPDSGGAARCGLRPSPRAGARRRALHRFGYFVQLPIFTQASLPPLNETPLLRDVQPLHLIKEIALQC